MSETPQRFLYIPKDPYLAERWLGEWGVDREVLAYSEDLSVEFREGLSQRFPNLTWVEGLQSPNSETVLVLPVQAESKALEYYPNLFRPDWTPYYLLVRQLWMDGFREFEFYSLAGSKRVSIPYLLDHFADLHRGKRCFV
ncbi:MAG: hypothetical protein KC964_28140, partial [Candidatus Omnitrophica bacterium]|nr:hypothetical protein [Candidatus Omnitrophota bacterium]